MTKTLRELRENMKLIDLVIEISDARLPLSGRNPELDGLANGKARIILLGKKDLATEDVTEEWIRYFEAREIWPYACDLRNRSSLSGLLPLILKACSAKIERDRRRGIANRPIRAMVCGIPNVGKSTFINSFSGSSSLKTGNKPGVTKGRQWIRMNSRVELLDTPGLLWPKFEDQDIGKKIALIGSIPDENTDREELAGFLIGLMRELQSPGLSDRYGIGADCPVPEAFEIIGRKRGALKRGGEVDYEKTAACLIDDFRSGKLGRISLERPAPEGSPGTPERREP